MNKPLSAEVAEKFSTYEPATRKRLGELRRLILRVGKSTPGVGLLEESLRWNQLSYLTNASNSGSLIRIDAVPRTAGKYALYFHCQTTLVSSFRAKFGSKLTYEGNRALVFAVDEPLPTRIIEECVRDALTYHLKRRGVRIPIGLRIK